MSDTSQLTDKAPVEDHLVIDNLETLKVIADPLRKRILECFDKAKTVKEVAKILGTNPSKLYYHVNLLEEHGLLRVTDTRIVSGIIEKQYQIAARSLRIKAGLLSPTTSEGGESLNVVLTDMFDETSEAIRQSTRAGVINFNGADAGEGKLFIVRLQAMFTPDQARAFEARLQALITEYWEMDSGEDTPDKAPYMLMATLFPALDEPLEDTAEE